MLAVLRYMLHGKEVKVCSSTGEVENRGSNSFITEGEKLRFGQVTLILGG